MRQTYAQIGMDSSRPHIEQKQAPAELSIEQPGGRLEIETQAAVLEIDSSRAWSEIGRVPPLESGKNFAEAAKQAGREGTSRMAAEGDQLMRIENGGNAVSRIAKSYTTPPAEVTQFGFTPHSLERVRINYTPAEVHVNYTAERPRIDVKVNRPELTSAPWTTDIYLRQKNQLDMWPVGGIYDGKG